MFDAAPKGTAAVAGPMGLVAGLWGFIEASRDRDPLGMAMSGSTMLGGGAATVGAAGCVPAMAAAPVFAALAGGLALGHRLDDGLGLSDGISDWLGDYGADKYAGTISKDRPAWAQPRRERQAVPEAAW